MSWEVRTMRSGTSYFNTTLLGKNLARFWPIWGVYALSWLLLLPVGILLQADYWDAMQARSYPLALASNGGFSLVLTFLFGILCAMAVFSYLYSARSVGMLHALPMRREGLFLTNYLSGLLFLIVPNFAVFLLALIAEALNGAVVFSSLFVWLVVTCLMAFFFYSFAVFCGMFTGHILALPAFYFILNFLVYMLTYLVEGIARLFLYGFNGTDWAERWATWLTPALKMKQSTGINYSGADTHFYGLGVVTLYALVGAVFVAVALVLYRRRQLERAGDVITVGWVRPVFRYGVALCSAIALGFFFYNIFYTLLPRSAWTLLIWMLLWGAAGCFIGEMLLRKRFWVFKDSWKGCVVFLACLVVFIGAMELDLLRFERKVPAADQVQEVFIHGADSAPFDSGTYLSMDVSDPEQIQQILDLHTAITQRKDELEAWQANRSGDSWSTTQSGVEVMTESYTDLWLSYTLTDGSVLKRQYTLPILAEDLEDPSSPSALLSDFINQPELVYNSYFGGMEGDERLVDAILINLHSEEDDSYYDEPLPAELLDPLLEAIQTDIQEGNLGRRYLLEDQERMENCCYADLELTFRRPASTDTATLTSGTASADGPSASVEVDSTYSVTITLQKSAVHTLEVLKDYPNAQMSLWEIHSQPLNEGESTLY